MSLLWEVTRSTAMVGTLALSAMVTLGVLAASPASRIPRFLSQALHRNVAALAVALVTAHVVTVLADPYVPLTWTDGLVPFAASYKSVGTAIGTLGVDVLVVVAATSLLRGRMTHRAWRTVHLTGYALWPLAIAHGLLVGTDNQAVRWICLGGTAPVLAAALWRAGSAPSPGAVR
ncbi:MAG: Ferric reductase domain protein transrane component domain protein [Frankiales bacterium]|nr:Ferric reductase domain protein transrane component domain protein [Frankiales bacterium]